MRTCEAYYHTYIPELSFVAELDGKIVGHFLFSRFPLSATKDGSERSTREMDIVMLAPVSVHADYFRQGVGSTMLKLGIPVKEPRCMMCQELYEGALDGIEGYMVYDMYCNA